MDNGRLLFVPSGGLANRMRAIASAWNLSQQTGSRLRVVWFRDWALNAPWRDIFEPVPELAVRDATPLDALLYDRPRRRNLWLPLLPQRLLFERRIDEPQVTPLKQRGFDFEDWARGRRCWMSCYQVFGTVPDSVYGRLFHPVEAVMARVEGYRRRFSGHTIGFHIRRTDSQASIEESPLELFVEAGDREVAAHGDTRIFLATDDEPTKDALRRHFAGRLITSEAPAARSSTEGIRDGLADMWTLAATCVVYGSAGSSFSPMAARVGGTRLVVLRKPDSNHTLLY